MRPRAGARRAGPHPSDLLWACGLAAFVAGFDIDAHDAVGQTAASAMDQAAIKQVKRLLGGQDASDVAGWGHQVDDTFPGMERLHFQVHDDSSQPWCGPAEKRVAKCEDNICLLTAIKHFYGKVLADEGRRMDFPKIDYDKAAKGVRFSDMDSVKMLINLIGDLHQPMHVGFASDNMGRNIEVIFKGKKMSLYDVWDTGISEIVRDMESNFWLGGWTHVRAVGAEFARDKELWQEEGPFKSFERWYEESVSFACREAYVNPITHKPLAGPGAEAGPVNLDYTAYQAWRESFLRQILIAGERTAIVLNDILDASGAAKLDKAAGVVTKADEEKEKQRQEWQKENDKILKAERAARGSPHVNMGALMTNLSIAVVVVPLFLLVANYGLDPRVLAGLARSILESTEKSGSGGAPPRATKRTE